MMKHSVTHCSIECRVRERHGRGILPDYGDVLAGHTEGERVCECAIDFHAGEVLHASAKKIGSHAGAGTNFEDIPADVEAVKHPRKDVPLYCIPPISGTAEPAMSKVHGSYPSAQNCVMLNVFPSGSLNHATCAPLGEFQIPSSSCCIPG